MGVVVPAYTCRAAFRSHETATGRLMVNVIHYEAAQLTSPADPTAWANDIYTHLGTTYRNMLTTNYLWDNITTNTVPEPGADPAEGIHLVNLAGTRSAGDTRLDQGLCALLSLKSNTPKKYARGRLFLPPVLDSAQLQAGAGFAGAGTYWTAVQAFRVALEAGFTIGDTTYGPAVFSRTQLLRGASPYRFPVVTTVAALAPHYLRSRLTNP